MAGGGQEDRLVLRGSSPGRGGTRLSLDRWSWSAGGEVIPQTAQGDKRNRGSHVGQNLPKSHLHLLPGANYSSPPSAWPAAPRVVMFSSLAGGTGTSSPRRALDVVPSRPFAWFSGPGFGCDELSTTFSRALLLTSGFSLPVPASCPQHPGPAAVVPLVSLAPHLYLQFRWPTAAPTPRLPLSYAAHKAGELGEHCPSLPDIQCLGCHFTYV